MLQTVSTTDGPYFGGEVYDFSDPYGRHLVRCGLATPSDTPPKFYSDFMARLDAGAGETCLFLPFVGEFGHLIMSQIRLVHWHRAERKIVCCRPGEEVLFPSAHEFVTDWTDPIPDALKVGTMRGRTDALLWSELTARFPAARPIPAGNLSPTQELIAIHPDVPILFHPRRRGLAVDVCLGVRQRAFCPERNWPHWQRLADALTAHGFTFAVIGAKATAPDLAGQSYHSGDMDTDAAIELLQDCRLYIGTDSGNSHLAATVGSPMLLFREAASGSRNLIPRMQEVNPGITNLEDGWDRPQAVENAALALLRQP